MQSKKMPVLYLAQAGIIAALYLVLTLLANALGVGSQAIQFRFSEVLTILPVLTPAAVPGLAVGCFLGNLSSPFGPVDWIFGTLATLVGTVLCRALRGVRWKGLPVVSSLMAVIANMVIISFEITCLGTGTSLSLANFGMQVFLMNALTIGIGEVVMCTVGGLVLVHVLERSHAAQRLFAEH
ncbi:MULTISPECIES: QueT transporter family protein [Caproicibacterium]|uniref:QueT transporter family protein n=1 Tax=Caproicibacterium argilliputei TaxID=3030016 RepID=A0AA97DAV1_9FIRM|nr:QueT transporter family protein [Caproicibacterium argilliputei]WOC32031.1 QueT transporter family protein [Caproicibacterium argilliputei]